MRYSGASGVKRRSGGKGRGRGRKVAKTSSVSTAVRKYVARVVPHVETKEIWTHDNEVQLNTLSQGALQAYPTISQGTSHITRVGNDVNLKKFDIRGVLSNNSTSETFARMLVVGHDGNIDPTMATFPLFLAAAGTSVTIGTLNGLDTMYFPINNKELHIYEDRVLRLAGSATGNAAQNAKYYSKTINFPGQGKLIKFKGGSSGYANQSWFITVVWIVADANDDTTTGTVVELSQLTRFMYTDC